MRGKWDSVDYIGKRVYLQENKTKGDIDEQAIRHNLHFDLQTMLYMTALTEELEPQKIAGVRYNVIRRPLSGGKGSIRPHAEKNSKNMTWINWILGIPPQPPLKMVDWETTRVAGLFHYH